MAKMAGKKTHVRGVVRLITAMIGFLCFIGQVTGVHIPKFHVQSLDAKYSLGGDAVLKCKVTNTGGRTVVWRKLSDPFPISIGTNKFTPSSKYRIRNVISSDTWSLTIRKLEVADAGDYECRVTGPGNYAMTISLIIPGDDNTHFLSAPADVTSSIGETIILPCKVNHLKKHKDNYQVAWLDQQGEVISLRKKVMNGDRSFRVIHKAREEWSLRIKGVREEHFGRYTCLVNSNPVISRSVLLKNKGPSVSSPFLNLPTGKKNAEEGETVELQCLFQGFPEPKVTWYRRVIRDGKKKKEGLRHKGMTLPITAVKPEDAGDYYCTGKNGVKPLSRGKIKLEVNAKATTIPPPTTPFVPTGPGAPWVTVVEEKVGQRKGNDVFVECLAIGVPIPSVYWKRHSSRIYDGYKYKTFNTIKDTFTFHSKLRIRSVLDENYGDYECVGVNHHGSKVSVVNLYGE
ncbi:hypothetical protein SNE40_012343 [Patella caerulea]|uniref:Ig-like domain-containing protein n=1 Tax=Patella caerulea TaxID=87958 RepID=A0AAN8JS82_PATCE